jgi:hypothetical protein
MTARLAGLAETRRESAMALLRWLIVLVLIMHGIGHIMGFMAAFTAVPMGWQDAAWLFGGDYRITSPVGKAWGLLWLVALIAFVGAGLGLAQGQTWWLTLAAAAAAISLVAIVPWWTAAPAGARIGAIIVDLLVLWLASPWGAGLGTLSSWTS